MYNCEMEHLKRMMLLHLVWCSFLIWSKKKGTMSKYAGNNNSNSSIFYFICFMTGCPQSSFHTMYDCRETLNSCCSSWTIFFFHHRKLAFANHRNGNMLLAGFSEFSSVGKMLSLPLSLLQFVIFHRLALSMLSSSSSSSFSMVQLSPSLV